MHCHTPNKYSKNKHTCTVTQNYTYSNALTNILHDSLSKNISGNSTLGWNDPLGKAEEHHLVHSKILRTLISQKLECRTVE